MDKKNKDQKDQHPATDVKAAQKDAQSKQTQEKGCDPAPAEKTQDPLDLAKAQNSDFICQLQRLQAEFENYKKRTDKTNAQLIEYSKKDLVQSLLPIMDAFELSLAHKDKAKEFATGMEMIHKQLAALLQKEGLRAIECVGKRFDPYRHEVLLTEENDGDEDVVLQELQRGYMLKDLVLRHSKVKVSIKKKEEDAQHGQDKD